MSPFLLKAQNFTNKGREFWVGYGHNHLFTYTASLNTQEMVLYLSAEEAAVVTVEVAGTTWTRTYSIPANTVTVSDPLPKTGAEDCRLLSEGLSSKGIHITSDVPIVAYAHVYGTNSSGAAMLLPVETYGYSYFSLNTEQSFDVDCYSWFYVVASENSTRVRITPSRPTLGGRPQGVPFEVALNKGQMYNVMGAIQSVVTGFDMSGSKIESIAGSDGVCHPISVFSGSSRTFICQPQFLMGGGDFIMQQVFPSHAWGTSYLTAPTSSSLGASTLNSNKYRVYVREANTLVRRNGNLVTGLTNNSFYEFISGTADIVTANKPVMVAQLMPSGSGCGAIGDQDPEMIYLSPIEQAIKKVVFYNTNNQGIAVNYLTLIIKQNGLASLRIDGSPTVDHSYAHPNMPGYAVVVKQFPAAAMQHTAESDSAFTAVTYGLGYVESYGYNAGTYINNLTIVPVIQNVNSTVPNAYTCPKTPFTFTLKSLYQLTSLQWHFSQVGNLTPDTDVTVSSPVAVGTEIINGKTYYVYQLAQTCTFGAVGTYTIPVTISAPQIDNCSHSERVVVTVNVEPGPHVDFAMQAVCAKDTIFFTDQSTDPFINQWRWDFGDATSQAIQNPEKIYATGGSYNVNLRVIRSSDGCQNDTTKGVTVYSLPEADFDVPAVVCMPGGKAAFINQSVSPDGNINSLAHHWDFGDGNTDVAVNPVHPYAMANTYPVTLIVTTAPGCADTSVQTISSFANTPIAQLGVFDSTLCDKEKFVFVDNSTGNIISREWRFGDGNSSADLNPTWLYAAPGDYRVTLNVRNSDGCVSDTARKLISVYPVPTVDAGTDLVTQVGGSVTLLGQITDPGVNFIWTPSTFLSADNILSPIATPLSTQRYYLTAKGDHDCSAVDSMQVFVLTQLYIPNAFTPNDDGINDKWTIPGLENYHKATVQIFNRWGQVIYSSVGYSRPWDGTINGQPVPVGVYIYMIRPNENGYGLLNGTLTLIR
jgi:gliding motility-associated-like protein